MKQLGNLAIVCAQRQNTLLQIIDGKSTVFVGVGPERRCISFDWRDDAEVSALVYELNHGRFCEERNESARTELSTISIE